MSAAVVINRVGLGWVRVAEGGGGVITTAGSGLRMLVAATTSTSIEPPPGSDRDAAHRPSAASVTANQLPVAPGRVAPAITRDSSVERLAEMSTRTPWIPISRPK